MCFVGFVFFVAVVPGVWPWPVSAGRGRSQRGGTSAGLS